MDYYKKLFEEYKNELNYSCDAVLLDFKPVSPSDELKKNKITNLLTIEKYLSKDSLNSAKSTWYYFGGFNMDDKGFPIFIKFSNGKLKLSGLEDKSSMADFTKNFQNNVMIKGKNYKFNKYSKFYLVKHLNKYFVVITDRITQDCNIIVKRCFNRFGDLIHMVIDTKLSSGNWKRKYGKNTLIFNKDEVILSERKIAFKSIKPDYVDKSDKGLPDSSIGVIDLETFEMDSVGYCYAIGFFSSIDDKCKTFYINRNLDYMLLIHSCINELLTDKYKNITFYSHNLGKFDAPFIIKSLSLFNQTEGKENPYILDSITRNSDILKLTIKRRINGKIRRVNIHDSLAILPSSLKNLCKDFSSKTDKDTFPYSFCNKNTLFYVGVTPDIKHYVKLLDESETSNLDKETINKLRLEKYKSYYKEDWSLQLECIKYLEKDLKSLYEVLLEFNKTLYMLFDVQMTESLTVSGIAMKIFLNKYYKPNKNPIPLINSRTIFNDIHQAYYGGRVEVYNPIIKDSIAYYYDVNSLYPYASLNPMPGLNATYIENIDKTLNLEGLFGFFYCKVHYSGKYLGLLPYRTENSSLLFPVGAEKVDIFLKN